MPATRPRNRHLLCNRFLSHLTACGNSLNEDWRELELLHLNLGPQWPKDILDDWKNIVEYEKTGWERPPGLGTCALEAIFNVCNVMRSWQHQGDLNGVVRIIVLC